MSFTDVVIQAKNKYKAMKLKGLGSKGKSIMIFIL